MVDVTNFVMMEIGQPLHAFDYHLIQSKEGTVPTLLVRTAQPGETFTTLDAREHALDEEMLLIADETRGIALAGVMGGLNSEINDQTTDVLIESACFKPESVRRTAKNWTVAPTLPIASSEAPIRISVTGPAGARPN